METSTSKADMQEQRIKDMIAEYARQRKDVKNLLEYDLGSFLNSYYDGGEDGKHAIHIYISLLFHCIVEIRLNVYAINALTVFEASTHVSYLKDVLESRYPDCNLLEAIGGQEGKVSKGQEERQAKRLKVTRSVDE